MHQADQHGVWRAFSAAWRAREEASTAALIVIALTVAALYFGVARVEMMLTGRPEIAAVFWPASGVAAGLVATIARNLRVVAAIGVLTGSVLAELTIGEGLLPAFIMSACRGVEATLFAMALEYRRSGIFRFSSIASAFWFIGAAIFAPMVATAIGAPILALAGKAMPSVLGFWHQRWQSDAIGILAFAPVVLIFNAAWKSRLSSRMWTESGLYLVILLAVAGATFLIEAGPTVRWTPAPGIALFPLYLWAASRLHPVVLMSSVAIVALIVLVSAAHGLGRLGDPNIELDIRVNAARLSAATNAFFAVLLSAVLTARKEAEAHISNLLAEVNHRAKNLLTVVQAVAVHTAREERPEDFIDTFRERIEGLAASHDLLSAHAWVGVEMAGLARSQLAHFDSTDGARIGLKGPPVRLKAVAAQVLGMALHELATNASKYGALSVEGGRVDVTWAVGARFVLLWRETGGPAALAPKRHGFGQRVLSEMAEHQLGGATRIEYLETGVTWEFSSQVDQILEGEG